MAKFTLRLPDDLQENIQTHADREHRSLHAQIIHLLSEAVQPTDTPSRYAATSAERFRRSPEVITINQEEMSDVMRERARQREQERTIVVERVSKDDPNR